MLEDDLVFRAQFTIAWPIWAGGYPTQSDALQVLQRGETALRAALTERLTELLDVDLRVELDSRIGAHAPINGLWPKDYVPNSVDLFALVYAPGVGVRHLANLTSRIGDAVEDGAGLVAEFAREQMPGAKRGANLYDVSGRWDPGPALAYTEVGEPVTEPESPPNEPEPIRERHPAADGPTVPTRRSTVPSRAHLVAAAGAAAVSVIGSAVGAVIGDDPALDWLWLAWGALGLLASLLIVVAAISRHRFISLLVASGLTSVTSEDPARIDAIIQELTRIGATREVTLLLSQRHISSTAG